MPTPSTWQSSSVALKRAGDPEGLSRVAGLDLLAACPNSAWPTLHADGGIRPYGSAIEVDNSQANSFRTIATSALGQISIPGDATPSAPTEASDWSHVTESYAGEFDLTLSRLTAMVLLETSKTAIRLCHGNVQKYTTNGTTITDAGSQLSLPKYVAYHTAGGYQIGTLSNTAITLTGMDQPWLLVWWGGNSHWLDCTVPMTYSQNVAQGFASLPARYAFQADVPLLLTFNTTPSSIQQETGVGGFSLVFGSAATAFTILPLYGRARRRANAGTGNSEGWFNSGLPAGVQSQIAAWYPRCQQFPRSATRTYSYTPDTATSTTAVTWTTVNATGSPIKFCPIPPFDGVARDANLSGLAFSGTIVDGALPTRYGPSLGIVGVNGYDRTLLGLAPSTAARAAPGAGTVPPALQARLDAEVDALKGVSNNTHWAPWYFADRIPQNEPGGDVYWADPSDSLALVAELLPMVSGTRRTGLLAWLATELAAYPPTTVSKLDGAVGTMRGPAGLPNAHGEAAFAWKNSKPFMARVRLWAAWALARYYQESGVAVPSGTVNAFTANAGILDNDMAEQDWATAHWFASKNDRQTAVEDASRHWAGLAGLAWLCANKTGGADANEGLVRALLAEATVTRVAMMHLARWQSSVGLIELPNSGTSATAATTPTPTWQPNLCSYYQGVLWTYTWADSGDDPRVVTRLDQFQAWLDDSNARDGWNVGVDYAYLAAYRWLVKPLAALLGSEAAITVAKYRELQPHWWLPYAEAILGQEHNLQHPADSYGLFLARAYLDGADAATLEAEAGYPWLVSGGDLFTLHKLAVVARAYADAPSPGPSAVSISNPGTVAKDTACTITFQIAGMAATNTFKPYDATWGVDGITVDGEFSQDATFATGLVVWPCVYVENFDVQTKGGYTWANALGTGQWEARFRPPSAGTWYYRLRCTDTGGSNVSPATTVVVTAAASKGRVRPAAADARMMEREDGSPFPALGLNLRYARFSWLDPVQDNASLLGSLATNGITYCRTWFSDHGFWGSESPAWISSNPAAGGYAWVGYDGGAPWTYTPYAGSEMARDIASGYNTSYIGARAGVSRPLPCKRSTTYRIRARYQIASTLGGPAVAAQPWGFAIKTSATWIFDTPTQPEGYNVGTLLAGLAPIHTATGTGYAELSGTYTTGAVEDYFPFIVFTNSNCSTGNTYLDYVWIEEDLGGGNYGPNLFPGPWQTAHHRIDQWRAKGLDLALAQAEANGIALQAVVLGAKHDRALGAMQDDGTLGTGLVESQFFGPNSASRQRYLHKAVGRYAHGRWGHSLALAGWEFVNEGASLGADGTRHANAFQAWATYLKSLGDCPMVGTSCYLHYPHPFWAACAAADWTDLHLYDYVPAFGPNDLRVDVNAVPETVRVQDTTDEADTALFLNKTAGLIGANAAYGSGRLTVRGEWHPTTDGSAYDPDLLLDTAGIWLHKSLWGSIGGHGLTANLAWWMEETIYDPTGAGVNHLVRYARLAAFLSGLPLNNGHYADAAATASDTNLRVFGQKDATNKRAHLWVDNKTHTWRNVVDAVAATPGSGTVSLSMPAATYSVTWVDPYTGTPSSGGTVTHGGGTLTLTLTSALSTDRAVLLAPVVVGGSASTIGSSGGHDMALIKSGDTAHPIKILVTDPADHQTGKTGLTVFAVTVQKSDGTIVSGGGTVAEEANGIYHYTPSAGDTNVLGETVFHFVPTGGDVVDATRQVVAFDPYAVDIGLLSVTVPDSTGSPTTFGKTLAVIRAMANGKMTVGAGAAGLIKLFGLDNTTQVGVDRTITGHVPDDATRQ